MDLFLFRFHHNAVRKGLFILTQQKKENEVQGNVVNIGFKSMCPNHNHLFGHYIAVYPLICER